MKQFESVANTTTRSDLYVSTPSTLGNRSEDKDDVRKEVTLDFTDEDDGEYEDENVQSQVDIALKTLENDQKLIHRKAERLSPELPCMKGDVEETIEEQSNDLDETVSTTSDNKNDPSVQDNVPSGDCTGFRENEKVIDGNNGNINQHGSSEGNKNRSAKGMDSTSQAIDHYVMPACEVTEKEEQSIDPNGMPE